jgi:hypothetical protein
MYINIFLSKALPNLPKLVLWFEKKPSGNPASRHFRAEPLTASSNTVNVAVEPFNQHDFLGPKMKLIITHNFNTEQSFVTSRINVSLKSYIQAVNRAMF